MSTKSFKVFSLAFLILLLLTGGCRLERDDRYEAPDQTSEQDGVDQSSDEEDDTEDEDREGSTTDAEEIRISEPDSGETVNPSEGVTVQGEAKGTWFFEGVFPVKIWDADGNLLAEGQAVAIDNWMTTDWVSFTATIAAFDAGDATEGTLVLEKDNPSGLPENAASIEIEIQFEVSEESGSNFQIEKPKFEFGGESEAETESDVSTEWDLKENKTV